MPQVPPCANHLEGVCPRSDTYVEGERHECFVIKCRTCKGINIFPREKEEARGKFDAFMKHQAAREAQVKYESSRSAYSLPTRTEKKPHDVA
jgi:hypothetical protein